MVQLAPSEPPAHSDSVQITEQQRRRVFGGLGFVVLLAAIFHRDLYQLGMLAAGNQLHSHILLIPLISVYLIYLARPRLPKRFTSSYGTGILLLCAGAAVWFGATLLRSNLGAPIGQSDYLALIALSLVALVAAAGFLFLGRPWMTAAAFPMAFLIFFIPLPDRFVELLETGSKFASAEVAHGMFSLSGTPFVREGLVFHLPGIAIEVAQECSGIRSSYVLFITSVLASHLFLNTSWRRAFLVLLVIPLGLVRNGLRILTIGLLCVHIGPEMIEGVVHRRGGPAFFILSLAPLFCALLWLRLSESNAKR